MLPPQTETTRLTSKLCGFVTHCIPIGIAMCQYDANQNCGPISLLNLRGFPNTKKFRGTPIHPLQTHHLLERSGFLKNMSSSFAGELARIPRPAA
ncbi:MAG: hypothetical protein CMM00_00490 [Rhodopirellula sp.]|nr:hypothetical protein [Rhodopirellula sp.]